MTNGYSAEYGRSSSGVISVSLKGGSNVLHGGGVRVLPRRLARREELLRDDQGAVPPPSVRRHRSAVRSSRTGRSSSRDVESGIIQPIDDDGVDVADGRGPRGAVLTHDDRSADAAALPGQRHSCRTLRSGRRCHPGLPAFCADQQRDEQLRLQQPIGSGRLFAGTRAWITSSVPSQNIYARFSSQRTENKPTSPLPQDAGRQLRVGRRRRYLGQPQRSWSSTTACGRPRHQLRARSAGIRSSGTRPCRRRS